MSDLRLVMLFDPDKPPFLLFTGLLSLLSVYGINWKYCPGPTSAVGAVCLNGFLIVFDFPKEYPDGLIATCVEYLSGPTLSSFLPVKCSKGLLCIIKLPSSSYSYPNIWFLDGILGGFFFWLLL